MIPDQCYTRQRRKRQWELAKGGEGDGQKRTLGRTKVGDCSFVGTTTTNNNNKPDFFRVFSFSTAKDVRTIGCFYRVEIGESETMSTIRTLKTTTPYVSPQASSSALSLRDGDTTTTFPRHHLRH